MRRDESKKYIGTDFLILKYGMSLYRRHGRNRHNDISQKMRMLARLVLQTKKIGGVEPDVNLHMLLCGASFDAVLAATEEICQVDSSELGRPLFKNPSFGIQIGHILVKCAELKKGLGIRTNSVSMVQDSDSFISLHKSDWTSVISSSALATYKHRRYNAPEVLPVTSDLLKLKKYQESTIASLTSSLRDKPAYGTWRQLCEVVYSRVVIFNKRRCGETSKLLLSAFEKRPTWQQNSNDEIVSTLMPLEQQLLKR
jgi:hypothetical protein